MRAFAPAWRLWFPGGNTSGGGRSKEAVPLCAGKEGKPTRCASVPGCKLSYYSYSLVMLFWYRNLETEYLCTDRQAERTNPNIFVVRLKL